MNTRLHTRDMNVKGDKVYKPIRRKHEMKMNVPNSQDNVANIQGKGILGMVDLSKEWKELFPHNEKVPYICDKPLKKVSQMDRLLVMI